MSTYESTGPLENPLLEILTTDQVDPEWLLEDFVAQGVLICLAGDAGAGKSFLSYTLGLALAGGVPALSGLAKAPDGQPRRVLYFDEENSRQDRDAYLRRAYHGLMAQNDGVDIDLDTLARNFWPVHFRLGSMGWLEEAERWVQHVQPHAIIFDTATSAFGIQDENDNAEATHVMKGVRHLMGLNNPTSTAIVLRHAKLRADRSQPYDMRGAKSWKGNADGVIFFVRSRGRPKNGLSVTRIVPNKTRAFGLSSPMYITPSYTDDKRTGLVLAGSLEPSGEHAKDEEDNDPE